MKKNDPNKKPEPPSLFDNLDLFTQPPVNNPVGSRVPRDREDPVVSRVSRDRGGAGRAPLPNPATPPSPPKSNLTGRGPMRDLYDFNFRHYSAYVICDRAIPAVEDGMKPVQRRIMHSLWEKDDGKYTKVANIVGHAMQYHPHGDASIGDAIVVLANKLWGEGRGYLIDGQGNYGSLYTGMPHAATRYIECRLTDLARKEVFNKKTTDFVPNYDGRKEEPVYLPAKIPLLLMLGADGIAVGLSTSILPHNFIELLEAEIAIIQKKPYEIYPDFQLGGVMDVSEYQNGLGKVKIRAVIEPCDKNKLVITQLPWGETTDSISNSIEDAVKKKKVQVRKIHDLTSEDVQIELELQAGASQEKTITALYAFTSCEKSIASRPIVLDAGRPRLMTVNQILEKNVERLLFLTRREQEIRLAELDDLFHARTLDRIFVEERIYKRIEEEKTYEGVQKAVMDGFKPFRKQLRRDITPEDVERLLKLQIRRISQFDINKNREDIKNVLAEEKQVKDNLVHLRAFTVKYLKALVKEYAKKYPRCTKVAGGAFQQADVRKLTSSELTIRFDRENHYVGTDVKGGEELFKCSSLDRVLFVWKDGRYKMTPPPDKFYVDKDFLRVLVWNGEKDREKPFTMIYEEPIYGCVYVKRFTFGGMIQNKEYRLAPEKSKVHFFEDGTPAQIWVKFKPAKNQRIHQQLFDLGDPDPNAEKPGLAIRGASSRGNQMTSKSIARLATSKPSWWDDGEETAKGVLL